MNVSRFAVAVAVALSSLFARPPVALAVISSNQPPVAVDDFVTVNSGVSTPINVLTNDSDSNLDPISIFSFTTPQHGSVFQSGSNLVYQSFTNYCGADSFTYFITDNHGGFSSNATVSVTVTNCGATNQNPIANLDFATVTSGSNVFISVLANDFDSNGDPLSLSNFTQPLHGSVSQSGTQLVYQSFSPYCGPDQFTYTISDGHGGFATTNVSMTVNCAPSNQPPVAVNDFATVGSGVSTLINVLLNDYDPDFNPISIFSYSQPLHGSVLQSGGLYYQSVNGYTGPDSFSYTITDNNGGFSTAFVSLTVTNSGPTNPPVYADLSLAKYTSTTNTLNIGSQIIYTLGAFNGGPSLASNVVIRDTLPAGVAFVAATGGACTYDTNLHRVDCGVGNLAVAGSATVYVTVNVAAQVGSLVNCGTIFSDMNDTNAANNTSCVTNTTVVPSADLQITKTASTNSVPVGATVVFNLTLRNNGPSSVTNQIVVSDAIPSGFDYVGDNASGGAFYSFGLGQWVLPNGAGASTTQSIAITLRAINPGVFTNLAIINVPNGVTDPNTNNNSSSAIVTNTQPQAHLQITKTASTNAAFVGQSIVFRLVLRNNGPDAVTNNFTVGDVIPPGFQYLNNVSSGGGYSAGQGLWFIPAGLISGATQTLDITVLASTNGVFTNTAIINLPPNLTDPNTNNNSSSAIVTNRFPLADLSVVKFLTASNVNVHVGEQVSFTIVVSNAGPTTVSNVLMPDVPDAGLQIVFASQGTNALFDAASNTFTITRLAAGERVVLEVRAAVTGVGLLTNRISVLAPPPVLDTNAGNNTSFAYVNSTPTSDLQVFKSANVTTTNLGSPVFFTIVLRNAGPNTSSNMVVRDVIPPGTTLVASNVPLDTAYDPATGDWTVPRLANSEARTLLLVLIHLTGGTVTNMAFVLNAPHYDPTPLDRTNSVVVTWLPFDYADLSVIIQLQTNIVMLGQTTQVRYVVQNLGTDPASNITVYAPLPPGVELISWTAVNWTNNLANGVWTRTNVMASPGASILIYNVRATNSGFKSFTAQIATAQPFDPVLANNSATTNFIAGTLASISGVVKCATNGPSLSGATITLTTSNGPALVTSTDGGGAYTFTNLPPGNYTVTPTKDGFSFAPTNQTLSTLGGATNLPLFLAIARNINGIIRTAPNGSGVPGLLVQITGGVNGSMLTDSNGTFNFTNLNPGAYTITPLTNGVPFARYTPTNALFVLGNPTNWSNSITFFLTNQAIVLRAIEVNQSVQDWELSVPLVQDKATLVRVFLQLPGTNRTAIPLTGARLRGTRGGTALGVLPNPAYSVWTNDIAPFRSNLNASVNFSLPPNWLNGTVDLAFEWTNGVCINGEPAEASGLGVASNGAVRVVFNLMPSLPVKWVFVSWTNSTNGANNPLAMAHALEIQGRLRGMYPIASVTPQFAGMNWGTNHPVESNMLQSLSLMRTLDIVGSFFNGNTNAGRQLYYGFAQRSGMRGQAAGIPGTISCGNFNVTNPNDFQRHLAEHEIGHTLGRHHAVFGTQYSYKETNAGVITTNYYTAGLCNDFGGTNAPAFPMLPFPGIGNAPLLGPLDSGEDKKVFGYDSYTNLIINPYATFDLMSYCHNYPNTTPWPWASRYTYTNLMNTIINRFGAGGAPPPTFNFGQDQLLVIRGQIDLRHDDVSFAPFVIVPTPVLPPLPPPGEFLLQLFDDLGQVVTQISFQPDDALYEDIFDTTVHFTVSVPYDPSIRSMMLFRNGLPIGQRIATPNAPAVHVVSPNGGEVLGDTALVQWTSSDLDGDALTHTVQFSRDGGNSWQTLIADWPDRYYLLDTQFLPATTVGKIRVIATDGFNTALDETDGFFTIGNHAPHVFISTPGDQQMFVGHDQLLLQASAYDTEDGMLTGIVWTSSLDGALGTGELLVHDAATLTEGTHTLTATATDQAGLTNVATVSITIYRDLPPLLVIDRLVTDVVLSWPVAATNYHLQRALSLPGAWVNVTNATQIVDDKVQVTLPASTPDKFFRLTKP